MRSSAPLTLEWRRSRAQRGVLLGLGLCCASVGWWLPPLPALAATAVTVMLLLRVWPRQRSGTIRLDLQHGLQQDQHATGRLAQVYSWPGIVILRAHGRQPLWVWRDMLRSADWRALHRWLRLQPWTSVVRER